jgi:predicted Zn-ribbon and HTH transcriptional regulator
MWTELCCCSVIFIIAVIIFFRIFGRAIIVRQNQQRPAPPQYEVPSPIIDRVDSVMEITMTKCQHCGMMYDERLDGCPKCGGN